MLRTFIISLIFILAAVLFLYTPVELSVDYDQPTMSVIPVVESLPESTKAPVDDTYDFIKFKSEHLLDIEPILQMPKYPTGCELVSLTMALSYVTGTTVDTEILIDDYITLNSSNFLTGFMGDPRSTTGGGCFPPAIAKCANEYLLDSHIDLVATDETGLTKEQIINLIDAGFPVLLWTTMYMGEPEQKSHTAEYRGKTYNWYISEHCVLAVGYDLEKNVFIINDPLEGQVERDIDAFMRIHDKIGNYAVIIC